MAIFQFARRVVDNKIKIIILIFMFVHEPTRGVVPTCDDRNASQQGLVLARNFMPVYAFQRDWLPYCQSHMALGGLLATEAQLAHWTKVLSHDIRGVLEIDEGSYPTVQDPSSERTPASEKICEIIDSLACHVYENCAIFFRENSQGLNDTTFPIGRIETLMSYARYLQRMSRLRTQTLREGNVQDDLDEERLSVRARVQSLISDQGTFYIDIGPNFSFAVDRNPKTLRKIIAISEEANADLIGLLQAHEHAVLHDRRVLWHFEKDVEDGKYIPEAKGISQHWMTLEEWIRKQTA